MLLAMPLCPVDKIVPMLRLLHDCQPPSQQPILVCTFDEARQQSKTVFEGLLVSDQNESIPAVLWVQLTTGHTAVVWLPDDSHPASQALMQESGDFLDRQGVVLAQVLLPQDSPYDTQVLAAGEFTKLADLVYLAAAGDCFPTVQPNSPLQLHPRAGDDPEKLGRLLLQTYEGSLDCPQLNGVRSSDDILAGYRLQGKHDPACWFVASYEGQEVGVLLLTEHPGNATWELVYMGIVALMRGRGLGRQLVQYALWEARRRAAQQMVLAVDALNPHAMDMYVAVGFEPWDRRTVYARIRP